MKWRCLRKWGGRDGRVMSGRIVKRKHDEGVSVRESGNACSGIVVKGGVERESRQCSGEEGRMSRGRFAEGGRGRTVL